MSRLDLKRPLAFLDIEATGVSPRGDRIVELAIIKLMPDGTRVARTWRINPEMPIPAESTRIHGITDDDVAHAPTFRELAPQLYEILDGCDIGGYNVSRFDIPMLVEEFQRAGLKFDTESRGVVDVQRIFHRNEPRDLEAAVRFFCDKPHDDAHGAEADTRATIDVFEAQLQRYTDLPRTVEELDEYCNPREPDWVDKIGRLKWRNGTVVLNFGRKKGTPLKEIVETDPGFIKWMLRSDFPADVKEIVEDAVGGKWPEPPPPPESAATREPEQTELKLS
jgi:DNA polymerase-3 subunit epsilon